jgi:radical SAM superfamily enzyme YgiQ (UPF0313 family)
MPRSENSLQPAVILVAERTLAAAYRVLFEGMFATMQTTQLPSPAMRRLLSPRERSDPVGRARSAVLGLRRIEAALLAWGLSADQVVCTTPEALPGLLGPWTRAVLVTSSDPLGEGMSNTTTASFWPGQLYSRHWTAQLLAELARARREHDFTVLAGGGGAWQWARRPQLARQAGIDCVFEGYFEQQGPALVADVLAGRTPPGYVREETTAVQHVQPIGGASTMGIVELSRGCGKGCSFCTSGRQAMDHLPAATVLADLETNLRAGQRNVVLGSEDFLRYGATGPTVEYDALHALLSGVHQLEVPGLVQLDHANVSSVMQLSVEQLAELRRLLTAGAPSEWVWMVLGLESANGRLVADSGPGKIAPFRWEDWESLVEASADRLRGAGFVPIYSLVLGLPGETPDDVERTLALVRRLARGRVVLFPVFHEPPSADGAGRFTRDEMTRRHLELYAFCYEVNFRAIPRLVWDNQRAGGVGWTRRMMFQLGGRAEMRSWRKTFRRLAGQMDPGDRAPGPASAAPAGEGRAR